MRVRSGGEAADQAADGLLAFEAGQCGAEAVVDARSRTTRVRGHRRRSRRSGFGVGTELGRVSVGGAQAGHDEIARCELDALHLDGLQRDPPGELHRAVEAEQFLDRVDVQ